MAGDGKTKVKSQAKNCNILHFKLHFNTEHEISLCVTTNLFSWTGHSILLQGKHSFVK